MKGYKHLDLCKRVNIALLLNQGKNLTFIAKELKLPKSTIMREIIRNRCKIESDVHYGACPLLRKKVFRLQRLQKAVGLHAGSIHLQRS